MSNSITYTSTDQLGNKLNKSVTDINANVSGTTLHEFARIANALTTNTLGTVSRVSKVGLDAEKLTPTLTVTPTSITKAQLQTALNSAPYHYIVTVNYDGDGELNWSYVADSISDSDFSVGKFVSTDDGVKFWLGSISGGVGSTRTITITASETDKYNAASVTLTVTN